MSYEKGFIPKVVWVCVYCGCEYDNISDAAKCFRTHKEK